MHELGVSPSKYPKPAMMAAGSWELAVGDFMQPPVLEVVAVRQY